MLSRQSLGRWSLCLSFTVIIFSSTAKAQTDAVYLFPACVNGTENGLQVDINGVAIPGAAVTSIVWNWGDGTTTTGFFPESHTYASSAIYRVQVTANYSDGSSASSSQSVDVNPGPLGPSNCEQLIIMPGAGGAVTYQASIGSGLVPASSTATLYLALSDDLTITASPSTIPGNSHSFSSWLPSGLVTGPNGVPVSVASSSTVIVVNGDSTIGASWSAAGSSTCSAGVSTPQMIPVIPGTGPNAFWTWNGSAPYQPFGVIPIAPQTLITTGDPLIPGSNLVDVSGDLWNLSTSQSGGSLPAAVSAEVNITYNGALNTSVALNVAPETINFSNILSAVGVVGYPGLTYGYSPQAGTITPENSSLALPLSLSGLPNLWSMINYSVVQPYFSMNLAYDIWISETCEQNSVPMPPNSPPPPPLELMIWPYRTLDSPIGNHVGNFSFLNWVNGSLVPASWDVYVGQKTAFAFTSPGAMTTTISFVLRNPAPSTQAYIGVNINDFVEGMIETLTSSSVNKHLGSNWTRPTLEAYYLNNISFGSEFVAFPNPFGVTEDFNYDYDISDFCFVISPPISSPTPTSWSSYYSCKAAP